MKALRANPSEISSDSLGQERPRRRGAEETLKRHPLNGENAQRQRIEDMCRQYESVAHRTTDFFTVIDSNYVYRGVNEAYCQAHGKSREEILGRKVADVWGEKVFRNVIQKPLERCLTGHEVHYQARFEFAMTGARYFDVSFYPFGNGHTVSHAIVVTRDITRSRRAEEEVRLLLSVTQAVNESQDFDSALEVSLQKICQTTGWVLGQAWIPSADGKHLRCGPAWHQKSRELEKLKASSLQTRWKPGEGLVGCVWSSKMPRWATQKSSDPPLPSTFRADKTRIEGIVGIPVIAGDEVVSVMEFCVVEAQSEDERLMGVVSAVATQLGTLFLRKRTEEALRESEERFRRIVETAEEGIWALDVENRTTLVNRKMAETLGYTASEMIGRPLLEFLAHEDKAAWKADRERGGLEEKEHRDLRFLRKDGSQIWALLTWSKVLDRKARYAGALAMVSDITARKRAEEALRQSEEHYRELFHQAYRMQENLRNLSDKILEVQEEERTRISRELHDEVGQALTAAIVNLAILKKEVSPEHERLLKRIADSQALLSQTMETVHSFARELRPAMLDDLGLLAALRSYVAAFSERTGIRVHFQASAQAALGRLDSEQKTVIYRIVQESLNNIAKHARASRVHFTIKNVHHQMVVEIADNGKGFTVDQRSSTGPSKRLGLLGMQERVRLVNGDFSIESEPGKGTVIRVQIPVKPSDAANDGAQTATGIIVANGYINKRGTSRLS